jgi:hypothetical protein
MHMQSLQAKPHCQQKQLPTEVVIQPCLCWPSRSLRLLEHCQLRIGASAFPPTSSHSCLAQMMRQACL